MCRPFGFRQFVGLLCHCHHFYRLLCGSVPSFSMDDHTCHLTPSLLTICIQRLVRQPFQASVFDDIDCGDFYETPVLYFYCFCFVLTCPPSGGPFLWHVGNIRHLARCPGMSPWFNVYVQWNSKPRNSVAHGIFFFSQENSFVHLPSRDARSHSDLWS